MKPRLRILLLIGLVSAFGSLAFAADRPPQNLHLVGDHWTAWDPPTPPEGVEVYIIVRGDTLWDLAAKNLGDPYLWPQIWEKNRYILDAHWIYPGDPLVMGLAITTPEIPPGGPLAEAEPPAGMEEEEAAGPPWRTAADAAGEPGPLGVESDIYCTGYIGDVDESFPFSVIGSEYQAQAPTLERERGRLRHTGYTGLYGTDTVKYGLDLTDIVYLDGGRGAGMVPGQILTAVQPEEKVRHPLTHDVVGRFYHYLGRVRVLSVQPDTAIGEIVHSCEPLSVGARLREFEAEPVPLGRRTGMRPVNLPPSTDSLTSAPVILRSDRNLVTLGEDNVVFIDRGEDADVVPGDVYTIYRLNRAGLPPVVMGELAVLSVHSHSSVARITRSRNPIFVGDRLELK